MTNTEKKIVITSKDIKDNKLDDSSWLHVLKFFINKEIGEFVLFKIDKELRDITDSLDTIGVYSGEIDSITLLVSINDWGTHIGIRHLVF